jgi:hypothetical protein
MSLKGVETGMLEALLDELLELERDGVVEPIGGKLERDTDLEIAPDGGGEDDRELLDELRIILRKRLILKVDIDIEIGY